MADQTTLPQFFKIGFEGLALAFRLLAVTLAFLPKS
jgi:hypothetical protein